jgi:hypothetical protein
MTDDIDLCRLRIQVARLEEDKAHPEGRLAFAIQETGYVSAKLDALRPAFQAAAPGSRRHEVDPVTAEELAAAVEVLRRVRPLPIGGVTL